MEVTSVPDAARWLSVVGYYRLSGYWYPYRAMGPDGRLDVFTTGTTFDRVTALYVFDRRLKLLVLDALDRIEIAMRVMVGHTLGKHGSFAHEDPANFDRRFVQQGYSAWCERVEVARSRSREDFVKHFTVKYDGRLPVWTITEIMDFGSLSFLYSGMKGSDRNSVAADFQVYDQLGVGNGSALASWFKQLNIVRNVVAHHSRLWNQNSGSRPAAHGLRPVRELCHLTNDQLDRLFGPLSVMAFLLEQVSPGSDWAQRVAGLVEDALPATGRSSAEMGFPENWRRLPFWCADT